MKPFVDVVKEYSNWKLQEKGNGKLSRKELVNLREMYSASKKSSDPRKEKLRETYETYKNWKLKNKGTAKVSQKEFNYLKEKVYGQTAKPKLTEQNWKVFLANYKKFKEAKGEDKINYKELKLLKESFRQAAQRGLRLREADQGFDPSQAAPMAGDPNAMAGAAPQDPNAMAGGAQDPMAMQGAIDQALQALQPFSQSGQNGLAADPNAGIPPVDGTQPADPNAQPMMEAIKTYKAWKLKNKGTDKLLEAEINYIKSKFVKPKTKYEQIKERIAARQAKIASLQECSVQDQQKKKDAGNGFPTPVSNSSGKGTVETGKELVDPPAATTLANGYSSGEAAKETKPAKTWPTRAMGKEAGGALQGAGATQSKVKESEEETKPEEDKLEEGIKTVTDVYVDRYINEPKLNFNSLKESMKKGLLG